MPTYEYQCSNGHLFERVQKMSDKPATKCPVCGAKASRKISGGQGLIFKGSGFYITDYGKDGKGARKEPESAPKADAPAAPATPAAPSTPAAPPAKSSGSADPS
ncbi:MAG: zinc ribbon domain-containing protein [Gemmatimonadota bacterium]